MRSYLDLLRRILDEGATKSDRTGTGVTSIFGAQLRFDLTAGFPLLTTKKLHTKSIIHELLWFLRGDTNIAYLKQHGVSIWDEWANEEGDLGPVYGKQWRSWEGPTAGPMTRFPGWSTKSRRTLLAPAGGFGLEPGRDREHGARALPLPVPVLCRGRGVRLSCQLYQRSANFFLGVPFNIASYALLTHLVAQACGLEVGDFVHTFGDAHLYSNHVEQARLQLSRAPGALPKLKLDPAKKNLFDFVFEDIEIEGYAPQPAIKAPVAV